MNVISIKTAVVSDVPTISYLGRKTFTETFAYLFDYGELNNYLDDTFNISKLEHSLLKDQNIFGILYFSEKPIGYYKLKMGLHYDQSTNEDFVQLQKIYILHDHLDLKLGSAMLDHILHMKEIANCKTIWLVVLSTNSRAVHFYLKQGFKKINNYYHRIGTRRLEYDLMLKDMSGATKANMDAALSFIKKPPFINEGFTL